MDEYTEQGSMNYATLHPRLAICPATYPVDSYYTCMMS